MNFRYWKWQNSDSNFTEICSQESNLQYVVIGLSNGLARNRRQAIAWTIDDQFTDAYMALETGSSISDEIILVEKNQ